MTDLGLSSWYKQSAPHRDTDAMWGALFLIFCFAMVSYSIKPKTVIRPLNVIFYNCLQSFAFYKASFVRF